MNNPHRPTGPLEPLPPAPGPRPKRVRFADTLNPRVRAWLTRTARCRAHLQTIVDRHAKPHTAGGQSLAGDEYARRIAAGDRTVLFDALTYVWVEVGDIRDEILAEMDATPPTRHPPGSPGKVAVMAARMAAGNSLFVPGDAGGPTAADALRDTA